MTTHPAFLNKPDNDSILWRYLSFSKFVNLLFTKELHLTRIDKFNDHFEGMWSIDDVKFLRKVQKNNPGGFDIERFTFFNKKSIAVSCWHENKYESAAMWDLYTFSNDGIAIKTTYEKLQAVFFNGTQHDQRLNLRDIGKVNYFDHISDKLIEIGKPYPNMYEIYMLKNISYKHENEVRALVSYSPPNEISDEGYKIKIDPTKLIEEIIIGPRASNQLFDSIERILKMSNCKIALRKSDLSISIFREKLENMTG